MMKVNTWATWICLVSLELHQVIHFESFWPRSTNQVTDIKNIDANIEIETENSTIELAMALTTQPNDSSPTTQKVTAVHLVCTHTMTSWPWHPIINNSLDLVWFFLRSVQRHHPQPLSRCSTSLHQDEAEGETPPLWSARTPSEPDSSLTTVVCLVLSTAAEDGPDAEQHCAAERRTALQRWHFGTRRRLNANAKCFNNLNAWLGLPGPGMRERPTSAIYPSESFRHTLLGSRRGRANPALSKSVSTNNIVGWVMFGFFCQLALQFVFLLHSGV